MKAAQTIASEGQRVALLERLLSEIREFYGAHANAELVAKYAKYFVEGYDAYGVPESVLKPKREEWFKTCTGELGLQGILDLGDLLWQDGKYEEGFLAIYLAGKLKKEYSPAVFERLGTWLEIGVRNWAHGDTLCGRVLGEFLSRSIVPLDALGPWRQSPAKFKRRAVPVTMLVLLKGDRDVEPLVEFLRPMMLDGEKVVHQGLGWFLRDAWKRQPEPVEAFLLQWKDTAARLIFQYATEKMTPEYKARFRREKTGTRPS